MIDGLDIFKRSGNSLINECVSVSIAGVDLKAAVASVRLASISLVILVLWLSCSWWMGGWMVRVWRMPSNNIIPDRLSEGEREEKWSFM
jgi:hypothetical protein